MAGDARRLFGLIKNNPGKAEEFFVVMQMKG
jgi:hypothetical protein